MNKVLQAFAPLLIGLTFFGFTASLASGKEPASFSRGALSQESSVRICALAEGVVQKCGTGVVLSHESVMTAWHVVSPLQIGELAQRHWVSPDIVILRPDSSDFEPATLDYPMPGLDIAILKVKKVSSPVILHDTFFRGEKVWAVGNPMGKDFAVVETTITGVELMPGPNGPIAFIRIDDKNHQITHGFSGGGLFTNWGVIGIVQMCSEEWDTCFAMPTRVIRPELH